MSLQKTVKFGFAHILEFVYPSCCLVCNDYIENPGELICPACWNRIETPGQPFCANCGQPMCENLRCSCHEEGEVSLPFIALGHFGNPLGEIIRQFKHRDYSVLGTILADLIVKRHGKLIEKVKPEIAVPIPLHSYRLKTRGFNQAEILADNIGSKLEMEVDSHSLRKIKNIKDQKMLDHKKRQENVKGAYKVFGNNLVDRRVLLIDDVITTGATLKEAEKMISEAGGKVVLAAVAATAGVIC